MAGTAGAAAECAAAMACAQAANSKISKMSYEMAYEAALKHAQSLSESGKVLQAGRRREDVLHFAYRAFGTQSLEKCQAQYELALNDYDNGRYEKAVLAFSKALDLVRALKGGCHKHLLANILVGMGNAQEARQIHAQALTFYDQARQVLEGLHANECLVSEQQCAQREAAPKERDEEALASVLVNIALVHMQMGDMEQAERQLRRASLLLWRGTGSALSRKDVFRKGSVAADIWHNLSCCLFARGETRQASHAMRAALRLRQRMLGDRHLLTASAALDLGKLLLCEENGPTKSLREAYTLVHKAYAIRSSTFGISHPHTLEAQGSLQEAERRLAAVNLALQK